MDEAKINESTVNEEEILVKELENLRAENQILRASLEEVRKEESDQAGVSLDTLLKEFGGKLNLTLDQVKEQLREPAIKAAEKVGQQMAENPLPMLLAAFGMGYVVSRLLDRR